MDKRGVRSVKDIHEDGAKIEGFFIREKSGSMKRIHADISTELIIIQLRDDGPMSLDVKGIQ